MSITTVFFSWQSDRPTINGRNLIEKALEKAVLRISSDLQVEERPSEWLQIDKDTKNVPGSPPIFDTILQKIERAAVFVVDLTFVAERPNGEKTPNPNVLIEYGYALRTVTCDRIIGVMNEFYGKPTRQSLPFDLADYRFPITYNVPDDASDEMRKAERQKLAETLEYAIRAVFNSEAYVSSLPKPPDPPPVKYREPLDGKARFRPKGKPLGYTAQPLAGLLGAPDKPVYLEDGPAMYLRVRPRYPIEHPLSIAEIKLQIPPLIALPIAQGYTNTFFLRAVDGYGVCTPNEKESSTPSVVFVFTDGEIWVTNTMFLKVSPGIIFLEEQNFVKSLQDCASFLNGRLKLAGPYRWIVGMEGVEGSSLAVPGPFNKMRGPCGADVIEREGLYEIGQNAAATLEPFFQTVFEACGVDRGPKR